MISLAQFLTVVLDAMTGEKGNAKLSVATIRDRFVFSAELPPEHHPKIIGAKGVTVDAVRVLLALAGKKMDVQCSLRLVPPPDRYNGPRVPFSPSLTWKNDFLQGICKIIAECCFELPAMVEIADNDDGTTKVAFKLHPDEVIVLPDQQVCGAIKEVLKVIGMANGRKLNCEVFR
ncbi:MAG: hypothetical protein EBY17_29025 [Acidobacteriia bacterium]|nr:hypothetical protein [Terriglobia bacterium]